MLQKCQAKTQRILASQHSDPQPSTPPSESCLLVNYVLHPAEAVAERRVDGRLNRNNLVIGGTHGELKVVGGHPGLYGQLQGEREPKFGDVGLGRILIKHLRGLRHHGT